jgi:Kef-type K+ transport system membrane component KefB
MILGFLIAGILIGPFSPFGLIKDTEMLKNNFSDIAIVLLLFGIGLSFPLKQLGEFSVIVLKMGQDLGVINSMLFPIIGMAVALTTFIGPMLVKVGGAESSLCMNSKQFFTHQFQRSKRLIDATLARAKVLSSLLYLFCHFGSSFHTLWRSCSPSKLRSLTSLAACKSSAEH